MWDLATAWQEKWCLGARPGTEPDPPAAERAHLTAKPRGRPLIHWFLNLMGTRSTWRPCWNPDCQAPPQTCQFSRSAAAPDNLHFSPVPRWCWCCWSKDSTLRTTAWFAPYIWLPNPLFYPLAATFPLSHQHLSSESPHLAMGICGEFNSWFSFPDQFSLFLSILHSLAR